MNRKIILIGSITVLFLMVSSATAVPVANSKNYKDGPIIYKIDELINNIYLDKPGSLFSGRLLDFIISVISLFLNLFIEIVTSLIDIVEIITSTLLGIISLIVSIVDKVKTIFSMLFLLCVLELVLSIIGGEGFLSSIQEFFENLKRLFDPR